MKIHKDFTLNLETIERLDELAKQYNRSRSRIIDDLVAEKLKKDVAMELYEKVKHELEEVLKNLKS